MKRREFIKSTVLAAAGVGAAAALPGCGTDSVPELAATSDITERKVAGKVTVPYSEGGEADLIVAGGGPAGLGAAVTAARMGKKVLLLEAGCCLGGVWTRGKCSCVIDFGRGGVAAEIIRRLDAMGARMPRRAKMLDSNFLFDSELMKIALDDMCIEAGVRYICECSVAGVEKDPSGRNVTAVFTQSKAGLQRWTAKAYLDTTGDGDLCAMAGCGFDFGGESEGDNDQPSSIGASVVIDDDRKVAQFINNDPSAFAPGVAKPGNRKLEFLEEAKRCGSDAPAPCLVRHYRNVLDLSCGFECGLNLDDPEAITLATVHARKEIYNLVQALVKNGGEKWKGLRIVSTSDRVWHRAARRIHGRYTISNDDIVTGAQFDDAVAISNSQIDIHPQKDGNPYMLDTGLHTKPFQIPFRSCQAADIDNLFMAGRCISGGFYPLSSYRMTGPAVEMGENVARKICEQYI